MPVFRTLALALALATGVPMQASAQSPMPPSIAADATLLSIATTAEATRVPDIATLSTGVVTQAIDANTAMRSNATQMDKVMTALRGAGITERDLQTSGIHLNPQYKYADNQPPVITGYQASNSVNVKVRDLAKLGKVLETLAAQGANQINGPSFEVDKPDEAYAEARVAALRKAQAQARTYADALGLQVRRIVSINEGGSQPSRPMPMLRAMAMDAVAAAPPVAAGETSLAVSIEVVFELGR